MRTFIAIDVPKDIEQHLVSLQQCLKDFGVMTFSRRFHITLKFLGEVSEKRIGQVRDAFGALSFSQFMVKLSVVGAFPDLHKIRVVWVGAEPQQQFILLQQQIDSAMLKLGFPIDERFHCHVTLARIKHLKDKQGLKAALEQLHLIPIEFRIDHVTLYKSTLTKQGSIYEALATVPARQQA